MRPILAGLSALAVASAANAQDFKAPPSVSAKADPGQSGGSVSASIDIQAPPSAVWSALTDCAGAPSYMPKLISCRIIEKGPGGRWEIREHKIKGPVFHPVMTSQFRADLEPQKSLTFRRTGGDWKRSEGEWRLSPLDGGKATRVTYRISAAVSGPVPSGMMRSSIASGVRESMLALRRESMARANG